MTPEEHSESQVVAEGLSINLLDSLDLTYQIIPLYDETEPVIAGWDGDTLHYVVSISKLPPGWLDGEKWISGLKRDLKRVAKWNSFKVLRQSQHRSVGGFELTCIDFAYRLKSEPEVVRQLIHFICDGGNSYGAFATPVSREGEDKLGNEVCKLLETAHAPPVNVTPLIRRNEDRFIALWAGSYPNERGVNVDITLDLKADLSFVLTEQEFGEMPRAGTGAWWISANTLHFVYVDGSPLFKGDQAEETSTVISLTRDTLRLAVGSPVEELVLHKIKG